MKTQNAGILPDQIINAAKVLAFARENGFPNAKPIYWDVENSEYGHTSLEDLSEDCGTFEVRCGVDLNEPPFKVLREWDTEEAEPGEVRFI